MKYRTMLSIGYEISVLSIGTMRCKDRENAVETMKVSSSP